MIKSSEIKVNPTILKTLRETSGYTIDEIAKKLNATKEKIEKTEEGVASFTLTQIKKLAGIYQRPLAAFFTKMLSTLPALPDYRINRNKRLTPNVFTAERRAYFLANKLTELTNKKSQIPIFSETLKPDESAREFRKYLKADLLKSIKVEDTLIYYKQALEEKLLISIIELPLKADDVRGFSISSDISIIVLNEGDNASIKLFSLFHETYHLIKRTSGICSIGLEQGEDSERECDSFAAEFLVPLNDLKEEYRNFPELDEDSVTGLSNIYGVSKQVIMLRLLQIRYLTHERYNQFKKEGEEKSKKNKRKAFARRKWDKVFKNRVGNLVIKETRTAYRSGKLSYSEVFDIFNMQTKYIEKFIEG